MSPLKIERSLLGGVQVGMPTSDQCQKYLVNGD